MFIRSTLKSSITLGCLCVGLTASAEQLFRISTEKNEITPQLTLRNQ
ncbi:Uncharacterised protein [Suttonella ornithocola]|uniref:Uncharacterized protein n=1 Tax=Suttonella ornithocola TaxID=279832 RepID=A0A380MW62_9GAMM|nr:Uncharacterised protein [Suttonella ornithocola]